MHSAAARVRTLFRPARRHLFTAIISAGVSLLVGVSLLAGGARAEQVTITLDGKVLTLAHLGNINAELQLAAKGVTVGTPGTLKIVLEATTPAMPVVVTPTYTSQQYNVTIMN